MKAETELSRGGENEINPAKIPNVFGSLLLLIVAFSFLKLIATGKTMLLDETDNNTRVLLYVGDALAIKLKSNPTTGFSWSTVGLPSGLEQLDSKTKPGKPGRLGEPGFQFFNFKPIAAGESNLQLNYFRPFKNNTPPATTFHLALTIEPRPASPSTKAP